MSFSEIEFVGRAFEHKGTRYVRIPRAVWRQIALWVEMHFSVDGHEFIKIPRPNTIGVVTISLPPGKLGECRVLVQRVLASIKTAGIGDGFDWGAYPFVGQRVFYGDEMILPTIRSQFHLHRLTPWLETMWLLGAYRADGSKNGHDFSLASKSRVLIARAISSLQMMGVPDEVMRLQVIYGRLSRHEVEVYYRELGIKISSLAKCQSKGAHQRDRVAELHLVGSRGFIALINSVFASMDPMSLSKQARAAYLLGFLDGDATCTNGHGLAIKVSCADDVEARLFASLLDEFLEREPGTLAKPRAGTAGLEFRRSVDALNAVKLLVAGAFQHNPARARLFHAAHRVLTQTDVKKHALEDVLKARAALATLDDEWRYVLEQYPNEEDAAVGRKGVLYEFTSKS